MAPPLIAPCLHDGRPPRVVLLHILIERENRPRALIIALTIGQNWLLKLTEQVREGGNPDRERLRD